MPHELGDVIVEYLVLSDHLEKFAWKSFRNLRKFSLNEFLYKNPPLVRAELDRFRMALKMAITLSNSFSGVMRAKMTQRLPQKYRIIE